MKLLQIALLSLISFSLYSINTTIYSQGLGSYESLYNFIMAGNPELEEAFVSRLVSAYINEARDEGVNWDIAFVQMCLETGYLKYGGLVKAEQNNFCGLGSFNGNPGAYFPTIEEGVRAHIQHLKAYGSYDKLNKELIDPRFHLVKRGSAKDAKDLTGKWATDPQYGNKLVGLLNRMLYPVETEILLADATVETESPKGGEENSEPVILEEVAPPTGWDW